MPVVLNRMKFWLAAIGAMVALGIAVAQPATADAYTEYCGGWKSGGQECWGGARSLYQTYGWGDQGPVCVSISGYFGPSCSSQAGAGVYSGAMWTNVWATPWLKNNSGGNNFVHGFAFTH
jgi:hypothetical protein